MWCPHSFAPVRKKNVSSSHYFTAKSTYYWLRNCDLLIGCLDEEWIRERISVYKSMQKSKNANVMQQLAGATHQQCSHRWWQLMIGHHNIFFFPTRTKGTSFERWKRFHPHAFIKNIFVTATCSRSFLSLSHGVFVSCSERYKGGGVHGQRRCWWRA